MWLGPNWSWNGTYGWNLVNFWDQLDYVGAWQWWLITFELWCTTG